MAVFLGDTVDWISLASELNKLLIHAALDSQGPFVEAILLVDIVIITNDGAIFRERIKTPGENIIVGVHINGNPDKLAIDNMEGMAMLGIMSIEINLFGIPLSGAVFISFPSFPCVKVLILKIVVGDVLADLIIGVIISTVSSPSARITAI